ncbi:ABC transporter substrate-binding protein [Saccharopolyspora sp. WRP15-2]|uniref:ABC transporter substrate-binding protein n=1 Tax=Saccharopolyspora oryzae TaxID=2997343 RepID=A0ABT4V5B6_9PSEU|nr:ABC transporter substrate-binding protein [Saccharopolyspora oryzae]MDA3629138.1 ABC transporter substrate-binding protein [Saccharopolyspora oryzae]
MRSRRSLLTTIVAVAGAAALGLTGCAPPNPSAQAGTLVIAGYGGSFETSLRETVIPEFEKTCSCKITYIPGSSTDSIAKLKAQQASPQIDVALLDDGPQAQAVEAGLLAPLDTKVVPVDQVVDVARLPGDVGVGFGMTATGIAYNPDWFAQHGVPAPSKWMDLADPRLKGALVLPSITNTYGVGLLVGSAVANGGSEQAIQPGFDAVGKIAGNAVTFDTTADVSNYFLQGQAAASVWGVSRVSTLAEKNFPVRFVYPEEGALALVATANVVNKAPHNELAQKFVAHLLDEKVQTAVAGSTYDGPTVKGVTIDPALAEKLVGPDSIGKLRKLDWKVINQQRSAWTDQWNKQVENR